MNDFDFIAKSAIAEKYLMQRITGPVIDIAMAGGARDENQSRHAGRALCPLCKRQVELVSLAGASVFFRSSVPTIERLAVRGRLHRVHNRIGEVMVCSESLINCFGYSLEQTPGSRAD